ncbi:MAG: diguanylate cyclase [Dethiobacteria bacterium]|jgi:diguanylate cyclase (GGDEF)-like protein/PAS domain S-box-containing protein
MKGIAESFSDNFFEDVPDLFFIHDLEGKISYVNRYAFQLLGYTLQEVLHKNLKEFVAPRFLGNYSHYLQSISREKYVQKVLCLLTRKKQERFLEFNVVVCHQDSKPPEVRGVARDITERKWAEKALADVLGRFESMIKYTPMVAIQSFDHNGCIYHWNPVSEKLYGMRMKDVLEKPFYELFLEGREAEMFKEDLKKVFDEGLPIEARECTIVTAEGKKRWVYSSMFPVLEGGRCLEAIRMEMDITERKKAEEKLEYLSIHDALTGIYNRGYFEEEMRRLDTPRFRPASIIVCDVDNLKPVNDTLGHDQGDVLLKAAAKAISRPFRSSDVVARIGGDEFAVILPHTSQNIALQACQRIKESIELYNHSSPEVPLSISLGVSTSTSPEHSLTDVFREADRAMYHDKINKVGHFKSPLSRSLLSTLSILFTRGFPSVLNDKVREMALTLGKEVGLPPDEMSFLALPNLLFQHAHKDIYTGDLQQKEAPHTSCILAIVNAYNTLTSKRPYRSALSHEEAVAEIRRYAGTQFDPKLVEKFIKLFG